MSSKFDYKILDQNNLFVNQIRPHKNKWAWDLTLTGMKNHWIPNSIPMSTDLEQWTSGVITEDEKLVIKRCLGFFAGSESLVSNNLLLNIFPVIQDAECRQYLYQQVMEEATHNITIVYICDSLNLNEKELYEAYSSIKSVKDKDDFLISEFSHDRENKQKILKNILIYYLICEGTLFYSSFAALLSFGRQSKIPGIFQQVKYTLRDENNHVQFGLGLINKIIADYPELYNKEFISEVIRLFKYALFLEEEFAKDILPKGILGINSNILLKYVEYVANRRLKSVGIQEVFETKVNPFPWMSEIVDLETLGNFFETRVQSYKTGGLVDDY